MEVKLKFSDAVYAADPSYPRFFEALQMMLDRMAMSHFKYGCIEDSSKAGIDAALSGRQRLAFYDGGDWPALCDYDCGGNANPDSHHEACKYRRYRKQVDTGNTENLLDAANCFIIEHLFPKHPKAHFRAQTTQESPGVQHSEAM